MTQEEPPILPPPVCAAHFIGAWEDFARHLNAVEVAIAREKAAEADAKAAKAREQAAVEIAGALERAAKLRELWQLEPLSQAMLRTIFGRDEDPRVSSAYGGTPHRRARDNSLSSGVGCSEGDEAGLPVFRTPPGLQPYTGKGCYEKIPREVWRYLDPGTREWIHNAGRARRQRDRRNKRSSRMHQHDERRMLHRTEPAGTGTV